MARQVLITGCSRGIGRALTEAFIDQGIEVAGCARTEAAISEFGPDPYFRALDVCHEEGLKTWAEDLGQQSFEPDLVIANAGLLNVRAPLWEVSSEEFSSVIDVNIKGVYHTLRAFIPGLLKKGSGVFVAFSSGWGRSTSPEVAPYCASKFAVEGLVGSLAQELPAGVAAVALSPGVVHTEMLSRAFGSADAALAVEPTEWARSAVPFLLGLNESDSGKSLSFQR